MNPSDSPATFESLGLDPLVIQAVREIGYEAPSQIQAESIPPLLAGRDLLGQAQTGTGKTAAFALPLLSRLERARAVPQVLVLAPTRELALQVAEAFRAYARHFGDFHILPMYGGQGMAQQLRALQRGVHVVVGTPGRVMDHVKRKTLKTADIRALVLDEADEMLRMGFADDLDEILSALPETRQTALFSATLPPGIRRIAQGHLKDPVTIQIRSSTATVSTVEQSYWLTTGTHKLDALTRILEGEEIDAVLIFVRTKNATVELSEKLEARGYRSDALNGDMTQQAREKTVTRLRSGALDVVVATDVAARGLDVKRISHVVNYDMPYDTESYVHRIGRTARAGRTGRAILFVAPREKRMLRAIENATHQRITELQLPTRASLAEKRQAKFREELVEAVADAENLEEGRRIVGELREERGLESDDIAAGLATLLLAERTGRSPAKEVPGAFGVDPERAPKRGKREPMREARPAAPPRRQEASPRPQRTTARPESESEIQIESEIGREPEHQPAQEREQDRMAPLAAAEFAESSEAASPKRAIDETPRPAKRSKAAGPPTVDDIAMVPYRLEVGSEHGVLPKNIVGAISNEAGLEGKYIVDVEVHDTYSTVFLPEGMPREILQHLKKVRVGQQPLRIQMLDEEPRKKSTQSFERGERGRDTERAPRKFSDRAPGKFGDKPRGKFSDRAPGKFGDKPRGSFSDRAPGKFGDKPRGKFSDRAPGKFGDKPRGSFSDRAPGKFGDKPRGSFSDRAPGKFGDKPRGTFSDRAPGKFGDKPRGSFSDRAPGKFGDKPRGSFSDRAPGKFGDKPRGKFSDRAPGKFGDKPRGSFSDRAPGKFGDKPRGKFSDRAPGKFGDKPRGKFSDRAPGKFGDKPRGSSSDRTPGKFEGKPRGKFGGQPPRKPGVRPTGPGGKPRPSATGPKKKFKIKGKPPAESED